MIEFQYKLNELRPKSPTEQSSTPSNEWLSLLQSFDDLRWIFEDGINPIYIFTVEQLFKSDKFEM